MSVEDSFEPAAFGYRCPTHGASGLIIMVGVPGSGKSYLGRILSAALGAELIQTDAVRKELYPQPEYTPAEAAAVYQTCHRRIREALEAGKLVVFDGTNLREKRRRALYRLAERAKAPWLIVVAYASTSTISRRLYHRAAGGDPDDQSDADWGIYLRMRRDTERVPQPHIVANTEVDPGTVIRLLQQRLAASGESSVKR